ncbi:hypothetical protein BDW02DRAFT_356960 [Decorospora gaudefroyi]|uniref:Uncharacterized protein n=1 Tax=Decorospora gaudefroyi TaxID=184978 RepID=A0A6A5KHG0_9PLEO|nr:hypothetical protein BDW02DRAFT_356960 [Decorospora gaudefroyi]
MGLAPRRTPKWVVNGREASIALWRGSAPEARPYPTASTAIFIAVSATDATDMHNFRVACDRPNGPGFAPRGSRVVDIMRKQPP